MSKEQAKIVFLDDSQDLRDLMQIFLKTTMGVECMCFGSMKEFENHSELVLRSRIAILDINLGIGVPNGIDAFHWLKTRGFKGKVLFFTGHARTNPHVEMAEKNGAEILEKPLQPEKLIALVTTVLNGKS